MRRLISVVLMLSVLLLLSSCNKKTVTSYVKSNVTLKAGAKVQVPSGTGNFTLNFSKTDSLNPYKAVTKSNRELGFLLYDSLVKLDGSFSPVMELAESIEINGKDCVITIKSASFTDGTDVTSEDVTYSLKCAAQSAVYGAQLSEISSYSAASKSKVSIKLSKEDPYFANLLDFPIIKMNTENLKDDDNQALPPTGSGRYIYKTSEGKTYLQPNKSFRGDMVENSVELVNAPDDEALNHLIDIGGIDIMYSNLSDEKLPKLNGKQMSVPLTNFVYIGINSSRPALSNTNLRQALANAFDRSEICRDSFYTYATPALCPYNSAFTPAKSWLNNLSKNENLTKVASLTSASGYSKKDAQGYYVDSTGHRISMSLLYNNENVYRSSAALTIADSMSKAGFAVTPVGKKFTDYTSSVTSGQYDLYLGEIKLNKNMDLSPLFAGTILTLPINTTTAAVTTTVTGGSMSTSTNRTKTTTTKKTSANDVKSDVLDAFNNINKKANGYSEFMNIYFKEMPFIPVCYRSGVYLYSAEIKGTPEVSVSDIYINFDKLSK